MGFPPTDRRAWLVSITYALNVAGFQLLSFVPEWIGADSRIVSIPYRAFMFALFLLVMGAMVRNLDRIRVDIVFVSSLLFWGLYAIRVLVDTRVTGVPLGLPPVEYYLYAFGISLPVFLAFYAVRDIRLYDNAFLPILSMIAAVSILSLSSAIRNPQAALIRMTGSEILNPITLGHVGLSGILLALTRLLSGGSKGWGRLSDWGLVPVVLIGLVVMLLAASRGALISLVVLFPFLLYLGITSGSKYRVLVLTSLIVLILPAIFSFVDDLGFDFTYFLGSRDAYTAGESTANRYDYYRDAWSQFLESPWIGNSLVERTSLTYPHNVLLESFMATGILGGIPFFFLVVLGLVKAYRIARMRPSSAFLSFLYVQALIGSMFSGSLYFNPFLWGTLGAVLGVCEAAEISGKKGVA